MLTRILFLFTAILLSLHSYGQKRIKPWASSDIYQTGYFIENKGQFERIQPVVKEIDFALLHNDDEVYFTGTGFTYHVSKRVQDKHAGKDANDTKEEDKKKSKFRFEDNWIKFEWLNDGAPADYELTDRSAHYFTYGDAKYNSHGYKKILARNMFRAIDVEYALKKQGGIEYTIILNKGADINDLKYQYTGTVSLKIINKGDRLLIKNDVADMQESGINAYYEDGEKVSISYSVSPDQVISFKSATALDPARKLFIDPWVSPVTTLTGNVNAHNKSYDVDFDIQGNLYALGGGGGTGNSPNTPKIAKYDIAGNLLWTFSGVILAPTWSSSPFASYIGNFIVDKQSSKVYMSQGFFPSSGATIIRLDQNGVYDNYMSNSYFNFQEIWEFKFNCLTGQLIAMGGGTNSNMNFGVVDTTTGTVVISNVTGNAAYQQDVVNSSLNSAGECFLLFNSLSAVLHNKLYKLNATYTNSLWTVPCGYNVLTYNANKNYASISSMGHNCINVNNVDMLYYYDGINVKAFDALTGLAVGTPVTIPGNVGRAQGGIYANNCNEVFIGAKNGTIIKYFFDGTNFISVDTLLIPGQSSNVHDVVFSPTNNLLYVCGNGYVATVDPNTVCNNAVVNNIQLQATNACNGMTTVSILNPDSNSSYTFVWFDSTTLTTVQTTIGAVGMYNDTLLAGIANHLYNVTVIKSSSCQVFLNNISIYNLPPLLQITVNASVCNGNNYTLPGGAVVNTPGVYIDTLFGINSCDTIITTNLAANQTIFSTVNPVICQGNTYLLPGGLTVAATGVYTDSLTTQFGCDSVIVTNLTVAPQTQIAVSQSICQGSTYTLPGGLIVSTAGVYTDSFLNQSGCDSVITTTLTVNPLSQSTVTAGICQGSTYTLPGGSVVSVAGIYTDSLVSITGCDSVIITTLTVSDAVLVAVSPHICQGDSYTLPGGQTVTAPGIYVDTVITASGCDSVITTSLSFSFSSSTASAVICSGSAYTLPGGNVVYTAGTYVDTLNNHLNCDSVITTILTTGNYSSSAQNVTICSNSSYTLPGGTAVSTSGVYTDVLTGSSGCDSTVVTAVSVVELPVLDLGNDTSICKFEPLKISVNKQGGAVWWNDNFNNNVRLIGEEGMYIVNISKTPCNIVSDSIFVSIADCHCNVFIPNAFSPNGDMKNDVFKPLFSCSIIDPVSYKFSVYNRWGQQIFYTNLDFDGWDGTFRGTKSDNGVYMYTIQFTNPYTSRTELYKGDVTLIR